MNLRDELNAITPRLRRYARALTTGSPAPCDLADDLVHATLMRAVGDRTFSDRPFGDRASSRPGELAVRLYATITQLNRETVALKRSSMAADASRPVLVTSAPGLPLRARQTKLSAGLLSLSLESREALLLVTLEGFEHGNAARVLRISRSLLVTRLTNARTALETFMLARPGPKAQSATRDVPHLRLVN